MEPTKRSAIALARGACTGVLMVRTLAAVSTASNAAVSLASRPRMRTYSGAHQAGRLGPEVEGDRAW
jgi:hypothetical protein